MTLTIAPAQAHTDGQLVSLWLHERSPHTQRAYRADIERVAPGQGSETLATNCGPIVRDDAGPRFRAILVRSLQDDRDQDKTGANYATAAIPS